MTQVSTQAELQAALAAQETDIQVTADFFIDAQQEITYDVTISSAAGDRWTLVKEDGFDNYMFEIDGNGSLTLQNIRLDGAKDTHTAPVPYGLISVTHGTLTLDAALCCRTTEASRAEPSTAEPQVRSPSGSS